MKKILLTLCMVLSLTMTAWAGNPTGKIRNIIFDYKGEPGFEVVDIGGIGMGLLKAAARTAADNEEDRQALELFRGIKRLTVMEFSDAAPEQKDRFLRDVRKVLQHEEMLMEAKDGGETVRIYGLSSDDGNLLEDLVILAEDALISVRGKIRADQLGALMKQADK